MSEAPASTNKSYARTEVSPTEIYEFFVVGLPGTEDLMRAELRSWFPQLEAREETGGLIVQAHLSEGLALNLTLKTATRVLLRLSEFGCRDFPKLFKKIQGFAFENWFGARAITFHASASQSRLMIKKRIESTCEDGWKARLKKQALTLTKATPAEVYVRFHDDVCTVSLDTSGEILHKRAQRELASHAPLRETLAASALWLLAREVAPGPVELWDPMTGGGTFLLEAAQLSRPVASREFAFHEWPEVGAVSAPSAAAHLPTWAKLAGAERDEKIALAAQENLRRAVPGVPIEVRAGDFFEMAPESAAERWVVVNPPYGKRLGVETEAAKSSRAPRDLIEFYVKLLAAIEAKLQPSRVAILFPRTVDPQRLKRPAKWSIKESRPVLNGGFPISIVVYNRA